METYVVRIWRDSPENEYKQSLRGVVENVASGTKDSFVGSDQLLQLLEGSSDGADIHQSAVPQGQTLPT